MLVCDFAPRRLVIKTSGKYRKWLPSAAQRASWGRRRVLFRKYRERHKVPVIMLQRHSHLSQSANAVSHSFLSSSTYIQKLRNATAWKYLVEQRRFLADLGLASAANLRLTLDETDTATNISGVQGTFPMLMMNAQLTWTLASTGEQNLYNFPLSPMFLVNKTAATLYGAISKRLSINFQSML